MNRISVILLTVAVLTLFVAGCRKKTDDTASPANTATTGNVDLVVSATGNGNPLLLGQSKLITANADSFTVNAFAFYISNLKFNGSNGTSISEVNSYHFFDANSAGLAKTLSVKGLAPGTYTSLTFSIGIDSVANTSLAWIGKGDLDVKNGMSWDWNTGYKFILLEGGYIANNNGGRGGLTFHVGFNQNYRVKTIILPSPLVVEPGKTAMINMRAEVIGLFNSPNKINFKTDNDVMFDKVMTGKIADNYTAGTFSIVSVVN